MRRISKLVVWSLCVVSLALAVVSLIWHPWLRSTLGAPDPAPRVFYY